MVSFCIGCSSHLIERIEGVFVCKECGLSFTLSDALDEIIKFYEENTDGDE